MGHDKHPPSDNAWAMDGAADVKDAARPIPSARGVLSAAEIEALLRPDLSDLPEQDAPESVHDRAIPDLVDEPSNSDPQRDIKAGQIAAKLSLSFNQCCGLKPSISLVKTQVSKPSELRLVQLAPAAALCFGSRDDQVEALIILPNALVDAIIAKACGAPPMVMDTGRLGDDWRLSPIDCALLEQLMPALGRALQDDLRLVAIETDMAYVTSLLPPEEVVDTDYTIEVPGLSTTLKVITSETAEAADVASMRATSLPVTALLTARLASLSVPLSRITSLKAGSTLLLGLPPDQPVEVLSGDRDGPVVMEGSVGRKGNKIAVKVTGLNRSLIKDPHG